MANTWEDHRGHSECSNRIHIKASKKDCENIIRHVKYASGMPPVAAAVVSLTSRHLHRCRMQGNFLLLRTVHAPLMAQFLLELIHLQ